METADPRIEDLPTHHYLACRREVTPETFRTVVDSDFGKPFAWLAGQGVQPAGAPFIRILRVGDSREPAVIEMGVPVADPVAPGEELVAGVMPAGRYVIYEHLGPYTHDDLFDLRDAQKLLDRFMEQTAPASSDSSGTDELPANAEYYEVGPPAEEDFMKWRTRMIRLVSGGGDDGR